MTERSNTSRPTKARENGALLPALLGYAVA